MPFLVKAAQGMPFAIWYEDGEGPDALPARTKTERPVVAMTGRRAVPKLRLVVLLNRPAAQSR